MCFLLRRTHGHSYSWKIRYYQEDVNLSYDGGGAQSVPLFLFVKTIEKVIRLCTGSKKKYLIGSFKDKAIFRVILEIAR